MPGMRSGCSLTPCAHFISAALEERLPLPKGRHNVISRGKEHRRRRAPLPRYLAALKRRRLLARCVREDGAGVLGRSALLPGRCAVLPSLVCSRSWFSAYIAASAVTACWRHSLYLIYSSCLFPSAASCFLNHRSLNIASLALARQRKSSCAVHGRAADGAQTMPSGGCVCAGISGTRLFAAGVIALYGSSCSLFRLTSC